jgi:hypothetical protein
LLDLGAGQNLVVLHSLNIDGNLSINGGDGDETVRVLQMFGLTIGGSARFRLGNGTNKIEFMNTGLVDVGQSLTYVGGAGEDNLDFSLAGAELRVGGNATFNLGKSPPSAFNQLAFEKLGVGGNLTVVGGAGWNDLNFWDDLTVLKNWTARLQGAKNFTNFSRRSGAQSEIAGNLNYIGGAGQDLIRLDSAAIGKNANLTLGDSPDALQSLQVGCIYSNVVSVGGSMKVTAGSSDDFIDLRRLTVAKLLTLKTGHGDDSIKMNAMDVAGPTLIELGPGDDTLKVAVRTDDLAGDLVDHSTFGAIFRVRGGAGEDTVELSNDGNFSTFVKFNGRVLLQGGAGFDHLFAFDNQYSMSTNFDDFEDGDLHP